MKEKHVLENPQGERALLGSLLRNTTAFLSMKDRMPIGLFAIERNQKVATVMHMLVEGGRSLNLSAVLGGMGFESEWSPEGYLAALASDACHPDEIEDTLRDLTIMQARREMIRFGEKLIVEARESDDPVNGIEKAKAGVSHIGDVFTEQVHHVSELTKAVVNRIDTAFKGGTVAGISYGLKGVQDLMGPLLGGRLYVIGGSPGAGKALALDTPIPTLSGWTTMAKLRVGSMIFDQDGKPTRVVATTAAMRGRPCFKISFDDGTEIVADADHKWLTKTYLERRQTQRRNGEYRLVKNRRRNPNPKPNYQRDMPKMAAPKPLARTTLDIATSVEWSYKEGQNQYRNHSIEMAKPLECAERALPVPPYTLGAWLGDGTSGAANITTMDKEILWQIGMDGFFTELAPSSNTGKASTYKIRRMGQSIEVKGGKVGMLSHFSLANDLKALGVWKNKHIPEAYLRSSRRQRELLLMGLMDTDGFVDKKGRCEYTGVHLRLVQGVCELLISLGVKATATTGRAKINGRDCGPKYRIAFTPEFQCFCLKRKADRLNPRSLQSRYRIRYITAVEPMASVPVKCIQVASPSATFLCGKGMIPTHNSSLAAQIAEAMAHDRPTFFHQIEMPAEEQVERMIAQRSGVRADAIERAAVDNDQFDRILESIPDINRLHLWFDSSTSPTVGRIGARVKRMRSQHNVQAVFIDNLLYIIPSDHRMKEHEAIRANLQGLKSIAKDEDIPVVLLSHLTKDFSNGPIRRPKTSDLYGGSAIEQEADVILLLYRKEYMLRRTEPDVPTGSTEHVEWRNALAECEGQAEVILGKRRGGKGFGTRRLYFEAESMRFYDNAPPRSRMDAVTLFDAEHPVKAA